MSGTGLLSLIRTASPDTIGVVLTGNPHDRELQHAIGSEIVSGVIEKPCDPDDVARALEDALHAHRERVKHE
jgi:CheY-like chemotaxis protein